MFLVFLFHPILKRREEDADNWKFFSWLFVFSFPVRFVLKELIQTEKDYVKSLGEVVEVRVSGLQNLVSLQLCGKLIKFHFCFLQGFIAELAKPETPEELKGKTRVLFGNIQQIYEWHKK